jgi:hypothetical protein
MRAVVVAYSWSVRDELPIVEMCTTYARERMHTMCPCAYGSHMMGKVAIGLLEMHIQTAINASTSFTGRPVSALTDSILPCETCTWFC